jgi:hypothetical protein
MAKAALVTSTHIAGVLALAHRWNDLIRSGEVRDRAELSRLVGVSRARVSQVMRLLDLAPEIQDAVLGGEIDGPGVEKELRAVAQHAVWAAQRRAPLSRRAWKPAGAKPAPGS